MNIYELVDKAYGLKLTSKTLTNIGDLSGERLDKFVEIFNELRMTIKPALRYQELPNAAHSMTKEELEGIKQRDRDRVSSQPPRFSVPAKKTNEVRHFYQLDLGMSVTSKIGGTLENFGNTGAVEKSVNNLKRALLYPHSIVIPDALCDFAGRIDELEALRRLMPGKAFQIQGLAFGLFVQLYEYLTFLAEIRPLVESKVVFIVPAPEVDVDGYLSNQSGMTIFDDKDWVDWCRPQLPETLNGVIAPNALLALLFHEKRYDSTLFFNNRLSLDTYKLYLNYLSGRNQKSPGVKSLGLLDSMLWACPDIELSGLGKLSWEDLIKVRAEEPLFAEWRLALERSVRDIGEATKDPQLNRERFLEIIEQELRPAASKIKDGIKKSSALTRGGEGLFAFGLGMLGGAVTGDFLTSLSTGAINWSGTFMADYLRSRREAETNQSFLTLYNTMIPK